MCTSSFLDTGQLKMALRVLKVSGAFEKRAPEVVFVLIALSLALSSLLFKLPFASCAASVCLQLRPICLFGSVVFGRLFALHSFVDSVQLFFACACAGIACLSLI